MILRRMLGITVPHDLRLSFTSAKFAPSQMILRRMLGITVPHVLRLSFTSPFFREHVMHAYHQAEKRVATCKRLCGDGHETAEGST
uniref:Uncharacterized protein n=1 Tax=Arundo donax TaxID=35708 RepID=A0A0A8ZVR7_ARUDO